MAKKTVELEIIELPGSQVAKKHETIICPKCKEEILIRFTKVKVISTCSYEFYISLEYNSEIQADIIKRKDLSTFTEEDKQNLADKHLTSLDHIKHVIKKLSIQKKDAIRQKVRKDKKLREEKEKAKTNNKPWLNEKKN